MMSLDFQKDMVKDRIMQLGDTYSLTHISGEPTWGGTYGQTPVYTSGTTVISARLNPIRKEIVVDEQIYTIGDLAAIMPYDTTVAPHDLLAISSGNFSGTWVIGNVEAFDTNFKCFCKRKQTTETSI